MLKMEAKQIINARRPKYIANVSQVTPEAYDRKATGVSGISRNIGAAVGTQLLGIDATEIAPGKKSSY